MNFIFIIIMSLIITCLHAQEAIAPSTVDPLIHEAFVPKFNQLTPDEPLPKGPPAPIPEQIPAQPEADLVWIPGYWKWSNVQNDFVWICGVWRRPPPNQEWIDGFWYNNQKGWAWVHGFWSSVSVDNISYTPLGSPPPEPLNENIPEAPGEDYFWIPGYWEYQQSDQQYHWLSGNWQQFSPDWVLAPASYTWRPTGFVFTPIYWDLPLEKRGYAYLCAKPNETPQMIQPQAVVQSLYYYYPDYVQLYWHSWHYHPYWWNDCLCVPPWWSWRSWWTFPRQDLWGLWWWWGHPGSNAPLWMSRDLSSRIAPPHKRFVDDFRKIHRPHSKFRTGDQHLLPEGKDGIKNVPKPETKSDIKPKGKIDFPKFPKTPDRQHQKKQIPSTPHPKPEEKGRIPSQPEQKTRPDADHHLKVPPPPQERTRPLTEPQKPQHRLQPQQEQKIQQQQERKIAPQRQEEKSRPSTESKPNIPPKPEQKLQQLQQQKPVQPQQQQQKIQQIQQQKPIQPQQQQQKIQQVQQQKPIQPQQQQQKIQQVQQQKPIQPQQQQRPIQQIQQQRGGNKAQKGDG